MDKKIRLPKEGFLDETEAEGVLPTDTDVEGHLAGHPDDFTGLPPPPGIGTRSGGHGGEVRDGDDAGPLSHRK